jgi:2-polyprenyl-3-methyl-5-hydroxy-6-metoxy-1,4-benzoquinol methylase
VKILRFDPDPATLPYHQDIYTEFAGLAPEGHRDRFTKWWFWADGNGLHSVEFLFPRLTVATSVEPFAFERRFADEKRRAPSRAMIDTHAPWAYQVEFGRHASTRCVRDAADWNYHRYRGSLLVDTTARLMGDAAADMTVLDVGCHCGVFALEFAEHGFGQVQGVDLRPENIRQANFLKESFAVPNVSFSVLNARDILQATPADIVFCGGLLYHVTFPLELLRNLFQLTRQYLVLDSLAHKEPISAFHLVCNKDVSYSAEGESPYEYHPTYRALGEALHAVGFTSIYEIVGDKAAQVPNYCDGSVRSFIAAKTDFSRINLPKA